MEIYTHSSNQGAWSQQPGPFRQRRSDAARADAARTDAARSDAAIEEAIWSAIRKNRDLGPLYQENIAVEVEHGIVRLRGHVQKEWHIPLIFHLVERVEAVALVRNELVADPILQEQVIRALLQDETTSPYIFTVKSRFGWVHLGGVVPTPEIAKAAEGVAGFIPTVRGILSLPSVFGAAWLASEAAEPVRRTLQPRIAASVYQEDAHGHMTAVGLVSQVILDPCSRLVDAIAVRMNPITADDNPPIERLVPMSAVEAAGDQQVWLKEGQDAVQYPTFERSRYPLPPASWRPPFPYQPGMVRWGI